MSAFLPHPAAALRDALGKSAFGNVFAWEADRNGNGPSTLACARLDLDSDPLCDADAEIALKALDAWAERFSAASGFVLRKLFVDPVRGCGEEASIDAGLAALAVGAFLDAFPDGTIDRSAQSSAPRFSIYFGGGDEDDRDLVAAYNRYDATTRTLASQLHPAAKEASVDISARSGHERLELLIAARSSN